MMLKRAEPQLTIILLNAISTNRKISNKELLDNIKELEKSGNPYIQKIAQTIGRL